MQFSMNEEYLVFGALRIEKKEVGVKGLGLSCPFTDRPPFVAVLMTVHTHPSYVSAHTLQR